jgi:hypothetical protein
MLTVSWFFHSSNFDHSRISTVLSPNDQILTPLSLSSFIHFQVPPDGGGAGSGGVARSGRLPAATIWARLPSLLTMGSRSSGDRLIFTVFDSFLSSFDLFLLFCQSLFCNTYRKVTANCYSKKLFIFPINEEEDHSFLFIDSFLFIELGNTYV